MILDGRWIVAAAIMFATAIATVSIATDHVRINYALINVYSNLIKSGGCAITLQITVHTMMAEARRSTIDSLESSIGDCTGEDTSSSDSEETEKARWRARSSTSPQHFVVGDMNMLSVP